MMQRFVFLGFDSADYKRIERWAQAGRLPAFRRLFGSSAIAKCRSPYAFYVGAQWPSFWSGLNTAGHGRYCYEQLLPGTYDDIPGAATNTRGTPFWDPISEQGRRLAVIDVPKTPASKRVRGLHVVDWLTHDPERTGTLSTPTKLAGVLHADYGVNTEDNCNRVSRTVDGFRAFRARLIDRIRIKERFVAEQLVRDDWDGLVAVFTDAHCAGHQSWHIHDERHDRFDAGVRDAVGDILFDVYAELDAALGRLLPLIPADCLTMAYTSHRMGPHWDGTHLMNEVLARLDNALPHGLPARATPFEAALRYRLRRIRPYRLRKYMPGELSHRAFRKAFQVPNNEAYLGIRINQVEREPRGRIRPGAERDAYCAALMETLADLRVGTDPQGPPAFSEVALTSDRLRGARLDMLPDIVARWTRARPFGALTSETIGTVSGAYSGVRTGDHYPDGMLLVSGAGIQPGRRPTCVVEDLAPTFAALMDVPIGPTDGHALGWLRTSSGIA